jgi:NADH:ubiquinone oxidoreductase subunit 6 (subunit J)
MMLINLYILALIGVTLAVILSRRTMYAILFLILLFSLVAIFAYSLGMDFIGLIFVIVYVGAIATLFLFIVMMLGGEEWDTRNALDLETKNLLHGSGFVITRWIAAANKVNWFVKAVLFDMFLIFIVGLLFLSLVTNVVSGSFASWLDLVQTTYHVQMFNTSFLYGLFFYENWYLPFLIAGVVLLIAMLGSIILTTRLLVPSEGKPDPKPADSKTTLQKTKEEEYRKRMNAKFNDNDIVAKIVAQTELDNETPLSLWLPQLLWTGVCAFFGLMLKDYFIISEVTRWIYILSVITIYLVGSFKLSNYFNIKCLAKKRARKS